ncbi:hypothetical protein L228DRAFT_251817, partial [Xylona heveae TC161]
LEKHFFPAKDIQQLLGTSRDRDGASWRPPHLFSYLSNDDYNRVYDTLKRSPPHLHDFLDIGHLASGPGRVCKFLLHHITKWVHRQYKKPGNADAARRYEQWSIFLSAQIRPDIESTTWLGCQLNPVNAFIVRLFELVRDNPIWLEKALTETYVSACQSCPPVLPVTLDTGGVARGIRKRGRSGTQRFDVS